MHKSFGLEFRRRPPTISIRLPLIMRRIYVFSLLFVFAFASMGPLAQADTWAENQAENQARGNASHQPSPEAGAELAKGQDLLYHKDLQGSIASFKQVVELEPPYA